MKNNKKSPPVWWRVVQKRHKNNVDQTPIPSTPIHAAGKEVGYVHGHTFHMTVKNIHNLMRPPALVFDISSLDEAEAAGAKNVMVTDLESGEIYFAQLSHIRSTGSLITGGDGDQIALPMDEWI